MEAFLLAAGLGTRLKPLTDDRPKALVEVAGHTLLEINIRRLAALRPDRIVVNIHHFSSMMRDYIESNHWGTEVCISDESKMLLDTGGALKKAQPLFSGCEPIVVHNVDVLCNINLDEMVAKHMESGSLATLAVARRDTSRQLLVNSSAQLAGWQNSATGERLLVSKTNSETGICNASGSLHAMAFSGIAVVAPELLKMLPPAEHPYPIIPEYLRLAKDHTISTFEHPAADWLDVGKPATLALAADFIAQHHMQIS